MERTPCTACQDMKPSDRASGKFRCRECGNLGYIEQRNTCSHLPPKKVEYEVMCGGWLCECGASGPWTFTYDKAYEAALAATA
jgi:hypothetical protein